MDIKLIESFFSQNNYLKYNKSDYILNQGSAPVLVSAPHCIGHLRNGSYKIADGYSGAITLKLNDLTGCSIIYNVNSDTDPNIDVVSTYKRAVVDFVKHNNVHAILDIHKSRADRWFDFDLKIRNVSQSMKESIEEVFKKHNYLNISYDFFSNSKNTVVDDVSKFISIPCIQLEINSKHTDPKNMDTFDRLFCCLCELVFLLEMEH